MKYEKSYRTMKIQIDDKSWLAFKKITKNKGMTIQGSIGQLIKNELKKSEASDGNRD